MEGTVLRIGLFSLYNWIVHLIFPAWSRFEKWVLNRNTAYMIIILYLLVLFTLVSSYRRVTGKDTKSLEFQSRLSKKFQNARIIRSTNDLKNLLVAAMAGTVILIVVTAVKEISVFKAG